VTECWVKSESTQPLPLAIETWPVRPFLNRLLELSPNVSAYEAAYLALAEHVGVPLLTAGWRLSQVPGHQMPLSLMSY
jgi:predicted nucleic acid-binding protein